MANVNAPPQDPPLKWLQDPELRDNLTELYFVVFQLYKRTGGGVDLIESGASNVVVDVSVSASDSPYTQVNKSERIFVNARDGDVEIDLLPVASDIYCNVIKTDATTNNVNVNSGDLILGETTQALTAQYDSIECVGSDTEYYLT